MEEKEHEHKHHSEHEHKVHHAAKHTSPKKSNTWMWVSAALAVILIISIFTSGFSSLSGKSKDKAGEEALKYINENLLSGGTTATLKEIKSEGDMYVLTLDIQGSEFDSYLTKDGKMLFPQAIDLTETVDTAAQQTPQQAAEPPKSDKPVVEAFVMSHCPYGTQIEKGLIPVAELLRDKIDFNIKFVYYAMHGEKEVKEQLNQYCIEKEQNTNFIPYLKCFLEAGDGEACLTEAKIDTAKLKTCADAADKQFEITKNLEDEASWLSGRFPLFNINKAENEKYGIGGSPSLVINGEEVSSSRDSASLLKTICNSFNKAPSECEQELSAASPSAGFGMEATGAATATGSCG